MTLFDVYLWSCRALWLVLLFGGYLAATWRVIVIGETRRAVSIVSNW